MKCGGSEAYLLGFGKTESSSNDSNGGAGHGGLPLLRFFPSAFLCLPSVPTVFSGVFCGRSFLGS